MSRNRIPREEKDPQEPGTRTPISLQKHPLENRRVRLHDRSVFYRVSTTSVPSQRPTLVLIHGLVIPSRALLPLAERLAPYFRVYAPDIPGFGKSEKPAHILNLPEIADFFLEWMQAMHIPQAVSIGSSFGSQIIAYLAQRHPTLLQGAVMIGPTTDPAARTLHRMFPRWLALMSRRLYALPFLLFAYAKAGIRRSWRTLRLTLRDPVEQHLPGLRVPTLVVRGARDVITPQRWAEEVARLLPAGRLVVIANASHDVQDDAPEELTRAITTFLFAQAVKT